MAFVAARVAPYKKVRQLEIVQSIPKSASGKILRRLLRDMERNKTGQEAPQRSAVS
jgi:acyl-coenzyme A synthetase/AMP-(fatty) acid ligase